MEKTNKDLEFEVGKSVKIVPTGELIYFGKKNNRLEFINRMDECFIVSTYIDRDKLYIADGEIRVLGDLSLDNTDIHEKNINDSYLSRDKILKQAGK